MKKEDVQKRSVDGEEEGGKLVTDAHESKLQILLLWNCTRSSSAPSEQRYCCRGTRGTSHTHDSSHILPTHDAQSIMGPPWVDRGPSNWVSPEGANQGPTPQKSGSGETEEEDEGTMAQEKSVLSVSCPGVPSAVGAPETTAVSELRKLAMSPSLLALCGHR